MVIYSKEEKRLIIPEGLGATGTDCEAKYREGYREGYRDGLDDCDCSGSTDCSSAITEAYQEGYDDGLNANCGDAIEEAYNEGVAAQKGLLASTALTANGTYTRENGWDEVFVNVPQTGSSGNLQDFVAELDREVATYYPEAGYDGFSSVRIDASPFGNSKYQEGFADGQASCSGGTPCDCSSAVTEAYQSGQTAGAAAQKALLTSTAITANGTYTRENGWNSISVNVPSGGSCNLETGSATLGSSFDGDDTITPSQGYDGFSSIRIVDNGYGQAKYDEGYNDAITANCETAIEEAYESGITGGYVDSTKLAYFNQPAWVETANPELFQVGDTLEMRFVTGEMGGTLHLLGNLNSGYTEIEYEGGPGIAIDYPNEGGLCISMFDSEGLRHIWNPFSSVRPVIHRNSGDTYHLILKTSDTYWASQGKIYMQVTLINESRFNEVYSASATGETIHFSSGATNPFVINGVYDENSGLYGEMNSELKIKSLKVYKPLSTDNPVVVRLNSNLIWKDGELFDTVAGGVLDARIYDQGMETNYYLPSADDELYTIW